MGKLNKVNNGTMESGVKFCNSNKTIRGIRLSDKDSQFLDDNNTRPRRAAERTLALSMTTALSQSEAVKSEYQL